MTTITFDTLSSVRRLRDRGVAQEQVEAFADELRLANQTDDSHLATRGEMKSEFALLRSEMRELESRMMIRIGTMIFTLGGVLIAIKYLH